MLWKIEDINGYFMEYINRFVMEKLNRYINKNGKVEYKYKQICYGDVKYINNYEEVKYINKFFIFVMKS